MDEHKALIVGNWKMHANHLEAIQMVQKLSYRLELEDYERVDVVVGPPFTSLRSVQTVIEADRLRIGLAAQNCHFEESGAFTGEVSAQMLAKLSVGHVIVGHSERRHLFGETDEIVNRKTHAVIAAGMSPIICVGETLEQRESGQAEGVVVSQLRAAVEGIDPEKPGSCSIAYEPVWAIGTGRSALPEDAGLMASIISETIAARVPRGSETGVRILYGGTVNIANIKEYMAKAHIDGALVGGASLDPDTFAATVRYWI